MFSTHFLTNMGITSSDTHSQPWLKEANNKSTFFGLISVFWQKNIFEKNCGVFFSACHIYIDKKKQLIQNLFQNTFNVGIFAFCVVFSVVLGFMTDW